MMLDKKLMVGESRRFLSLAVPMEPGPRDPGLLE